MAHGVPAVDRDERQGQHRHRHGNSLQMCQKRKELEFDTTAKQRQMIKRQVDLVIENLRPRQKKKKEKSAENLQLGVKSSSELSCQTL